MIKNNTISNLHKSKITNRLNMMKKIVIKMAIGAILFFLLFVVMGETNLFAQTFTMNNLKYSVKSDGSVAIIGHSYHFTPGTIIIDGYVTYNGKRYTVTEIGTEAFTKLYRANSIHIPGTVNTIGNYAFYHNYLNNLEGLTSIVIAEGVRSIGDYAFAECRLLTSISIPNSVTEIGRSAFENCYELKSIKIPNGVTEIGSSTFDGCRNLTSVTIPNSVTSIGFCAFCSCKGLTSVTIPSSVTYIGTDAFRLCENLTSVIIQNPNLQIDFEKVFDDCKKLQPSNVKYSYVYEKYVQDSPTEVLEYWGLLRKDASNYRFTENDLSPLSAKELTYLRNSVYAKHGYVFNSQELNNYFKQFSWYHPNPNVTDAALNSTEKEIVEFIRHYQEQTGKTYKPQ